MTAEVYQMLEFSTLLFQFCALCTFTHHMATTTRHLSFEQQKSIKNLFGMLVLIFIFSSVLFCSSDTKPATPIALIDGCFATTMFILCWTLIPRHKVRSTTEIKDSRMNEQQCHEKPDHRLSDRSVALSLLVSVLISMMLYGLLLVARSHVKLLVYEAAEVMFRITDALFYGPLIFWHNLKSSVWSRSRIDLEPFTSVTHGQAVVVPVVQYDQESGSAACLASNGDANC